MRLPAAAAFLAAFFMSEVMAQPICGSYAVIKNMVERQEERLRFRGFSESGENLLEIFVDDRENNSGGFTVIIQRIIKGKNTKTCVVFSGFGFEDARGDTPWRTPSGEPS